MLTVAHARSRVTTSSSLALTRVARVVAGKVLEQDVQHAVHGVTFSPFVGTWAEYLVLRSSVCAVDELARHDEGHEDYARVLDVEREPASRSAKCVTGSEVPEAGWHPMEGNVLERHICMYVSIRWRAWWCVLGNMISSPSR
jgi:hypothetical protein